MVSDLVVTSQNLEGEWCSLTEPGLAELPGSWQDPVSYFDIWGPIVGAKNNSKINRSLKI